MLLALLLVELLLDFLDALLVARLRVDLLVAILLATVPAASTNGAELVTLNNVPLVGCVKTVMNFTAL